MSALASGLLAVPAGAQEDVPADCLIDASEAAEFEGELEAIGQAAACGRPVEVIDQRDEFGRVVALPSGELQAEIGVEPVRAQDASGVWAPIDTTLEVAGDGSVRPVNITEDLAFSSGGMAPLATVGYGAEGAFMLTWPEALPAPVLDGPQAVYAEVLPGVDLVVEATAQGFRYDLVVADAEAAQNPELEAIAFGVEGANVDVVAAESGLVEVQVAGKTEMMSAQALMWETSALSEGTAVVPELHAMTDIAEDPDQEVASVEVAVEDEDLVLRPDLDLLRGADTRYPVVIDPQWDGGIQGNIWGLVNTKYKDSTFYRGKNTSGSYFMSNTGTYGNAGAGQTCDSWTGLNCNSSTYDMRTIFRMDTDTITQNEYKVPSKALFKISQRHSASCSNGQMRLYRTNSYNANTTWANQPAWHEYASTSSAKHGAACSGSANVSFNVTSMIKMGDEKNWANLHLGLRAPSESPSPALLQWNRFDASTAVLEITYDVMPYAVSNRKINGVFCTTSVENAPWTNSRTPRMSALYRTQDTKLKYQARLRSSTPSDQIVFDYTSGDLTANKEYSNTLPSQYAIGDGLYYWLARSFSVTNNNLASPWSPPCRFKVDATKPTTPTVTPGADGPYSVGDDIELILSSTDPVVNNTASGIVRFEYSWGTDNYLQKIPSTGSATLTRADLTAGRHVLYVRSVDAAGNTSLAKTYTFFAGNDIPATPMATWRFEGDTDDDSGHGFDLEPAAGTVAYTTDRDSRTNGALALDGATCLETGAPVINTGAAFSVSAWVRLDSAEGYTKALVQAGDAHSAFQIQYGAAEDKWFFSMLSSPGADFEWRSVGAPATAELGEWQHVAGTYDPEGGLSRIYIDGVLAGEMALDFEPWNGQGSMGVGCLLNPSGSTANYVTGAIDQVGVWQGLLSQTQIQAAMTDLPTASIQAQWTFRNDGTDESGHGRDLNTDGIPVGTDPYQRPSGAIELDGDTCLEYPQPIVTTDRSFTVAAWVRLDDADSDGTAVTLAGDADSGFMLRYSSTYKRFEFTTPSDLAPADGDGPQAFAVYDPVPEAGKWYHLTGVYDATDNETRLYLNGARVQTQTAPSEPWTATGTTLIGCAGPASGTKLDYWQGALHGVSLWRGPIDSTQIAGLMGNPPASIAARWNFDNFLSDPEHPPTPGADLTGSGHDLSFSEPVTFDFTGYNGELDNALLVDGTSHARTAAAVIDTDESFTIATWIRLDDLTSDGVAVSITGDSRSVISVKHSVAQDAWEFAAPPSASNEGWQVARSAAPPTTDVWTLLIGVYDLPKNELRLYINGSLVATAGNVVLPASTGQVVIGAEGHTDGTVSRGFIGSIDDTVIWQGALECRTIATIFNPTLPEEVCAS